MLAGSWVAVLTIFALNCWWSYLLQKRHNERKGFYLIADAASESVKQQAYSLLRQARHIAERNAEDYCVCKACGKIVQGTCPCQLVLSNVLQENTNGPLHPDSERGNLVLGREHDSHQPV